MKQAATELYFIIIFFFNKRNLQKFTFTTVFVVSRGDADECYYHVSARLWKQITRRGAIFVTTENRAVFPKCQQKAVSIGDFILLSSKRSTDEIVLRGIG